MRIARLRRVPQGVILSGCLYDAPPFGQILCLVCRHFFCLFLFLPILCCILVCRPFIGGPPNVWMFEREWPLARKACLTAVIAGPIRGLVAFLSSTGYLRPLCLPDREPFAIRRRARVCVCGSDRCEASAVEMFHTTCSSLYASDVVIWPTRQPRFL